MEINGDRGVCNDVDAPRLTDGPGDANVIPVANGGVCANDVNAPTRLTVGSVRNGCICANDVDAPRLTVDRPDDGNVSGDAGELLGDNGCKKRFFFCNVPFVLLLQSSAFFDVGGFFFCMICFLSSTSVLSQSVSSLSSLKA